MAEKIAASDLDNYVLSAVLEFQNFVAPGLRWLLQRDRYIVTV